MTTTIDQYNSDSTELQSLLETICCVMENVDNIGFITKQIGPDERTQHIDP